MSSGFQRRHLAEAPFVQGRGCPARGDENRAGSGAAGVARGFPRARARRGLRFACRSGAQRSPRACASPSAHRIWRACSAAPIALSIKWGHSARSAGSGGSPRGAGARSEDQGKRVRVGGSARQLHGFLAEPSRAARERVVRRGASGPTWRRARRGVRRYPLEALRSLLSRSPTRRWSTIPPSLCTRP